MATFEKIDRKTVEIKFSALSLPGQSTASIEYPSSR